MHRQRWVSGLIIALGVVLVVLFAPPWFFLLIILGLIYLGQREYFKLSLPALSSRKKLGGFLLSLLIPLSFYASKIQCFFAGISIILFTLIVLTLLEKGDFTARLGQMQRLLMGVFYVPFFLSFFILLYQLAQGRLWILFALSAIYGGDIAAFYIGRKWGKRKLAPLLSPGKTFAGGGGAICGSLAGAFLFKILFFHKVPFWTVACIGLGVGILGQIGDLFESLLKREAQVKDSGGLIPGHGGLLDRIDSVLLAVPWVYFWAWSFN